MTALDCPLTDLIGQGTRNDCDCGLSAFHRWNCATTPMWAQTMRDLDINPWLSAQLISVYSQSFSVGAAYV